MAKDRKHPKSGMGAPRNGGIDDSKQATPLYKSGTMNGPTGGQMYSREKILLELLRGELPAWSVQLRPQGPRDADLHEVDPDAWSGARGPA
jgi:hypothetical protein